MIKKLKIHIERTGLWLDADVTYRQSESWFGHTSRDLKMDVIYPNTKQSRSWPCLVWIGGGGWMQMDYHAHIPNFIKLARNGFIIASIQYRVSNEVTFPGQLLDIKAAIRYLRANSERYQINTDYIGVMGESAGGHLAGLLATTNKRKEFEEGDYMEYSSSVQAACLWFMVSDLTKFPIKNDVPGFSPEARMLGVVPSHDLEKARAASPITYVSEEAPPFLLLHGINDSIVPHEQSVLFHDALAKKGVSVDLYSIEDANHADQHFFQEKIMELVITFFNKHLK